MLAKPENTRASRSGVAADPFEHAAAVTDHMRKHVDGGVRPGDEAAVVPDLFGGRQHRPIISWAGARLELIGPALISPEPQLTGRLRLAASRHTCRRG